MRVSTIIVVYVIYRTSPQLYIFSRSCYIKSRAVAYNEVSIKIKLKDIYTSRQTERDLTPYCRSTTVWSYWCVIHSIAVFNYGLSPLVR